MQHFLAIDQGTSGTKAIVVDDAGHIVSIAEVSVRPEYLAGGGVEQDPVALFDSVVDAGRQALAQAGVPVAAVALANHGETVLAWIQLKPGVEATEEEIREFCRGKIAYFKIPQFITFVTGFPMTVTRKVQKFLIRDQEIRARGLEEVARTPTA